MQVLAKTCMSKGKSWQIRTCLNANLDQDVQVLMQDLAMTFKFRCKSRPKRASLNASLGQDVHF